MHNERTAYLSAKQDEVRNHYDAAASAWPTWLRKRKYYYQRKAKLLRHLMPIPGRVLEIGCGMGQNLAALNPDYGLGIDLSGKCISAARKLYPASDYANLEFRQLDALDCAEIGETFDYILLSNCITEIPDLIGLFKQIRVLCTPATRVVVLNFNYLLAPFVEWSGNLGLAPKHPSQNWLTRLDLGNVAELQGFEAVRDCFDMNMPFGIPLASNFLNRYLPLIPGMKYFSLLYASVYRPLMEMGPVDEYSVSVCVPCKDEEGNIDGLVERIPNLGRETEIIFVDDQSTDRTAEYVRKHMKDCPEKNIRLVAGPGVNKGGACRAGFAAAKNDILMILDADMTVMPEDLPDFVEAIASGRGEFINGSRLVYPLEGSAMRFANILGNKAFAMLFSFVLSQRLKDTLCGTKVIWRRDYVKIMEARKHFGEVDRWGDYDWIFGAARHSLRLIELPVHYRERVEGETKMTKRFHNGVVMLKMCLVALRKIKLL